MQLSASFMMNISMEELEKDLHPIFKAEPSDLWDKVYKKVSIVREIIVGTKLLCKNSFKRLFIKPESLGKILEMHLPSVCWHACIFHYGVFILLIYIYI